MVIMWQYNGAGSWYDILTWCAEHIPNHCFPNQAETIFFTDDAAYTAFLLRWT